MAMMRAWSVLCIVVTAMLWACQEVQAAPAKGAKDHGKGQDHVSEEEVDVLMFGVVQFSASLHHTYEAMKSRLARLSRAVRTTESLMRRVDRATIDAKQAEVQIKQGLSYIQEQSAHLRSSTQQAKGKVEQVEQEEEELKQRLAKLESALMRTSPGKIHTLKEKVRRNARLLKDLLESTREQQKSLKQQNEQLAELQQQNES